MNKIITVLFISVLLSSQAIAQVPLKANEEAFHLFDFWIGKWDVYYFGTEKMAGKSQIEAINEHTAILEDYKAVDINYIGKGISKYNPSKDLLEQYWTDRSGRTLYVTGGLKDGKIILDDASCGGSKSINKLVIEKMQNSTVRLTWLESIDAQKTWKTVFDGEYRKAKE